VLLPRRVMERRVKAFVSRGPDIAVDPRQSEAISDA
jgi:hypothetical protein